MPLCRVGRGFKSDPKPKGPVTPDAGPVRQEPAPSNSAQPGDVQQPQAGPEPLANPPPFLAPEDATMGGTQDDRQAQNVTTQPLAPAAADAAVPAAEPTAANQAPFLAPEDDSMGVTLGEPQQTQEDAAQELEPEPVPEAEDGSPGSDSSDYSDSTSPPQDPDTSGSC